MASILLRFQGAGSAEDAHRAVSTNEGVAGWWNSKAEGPAGPGSVLKVPFPDVHATFEFEVTEDAPDKRVAWHCLAGPPEWIDTDISFDIERGDEGELSVLFTHDGWKTTRESFPFIAYSWAQILARLKALIEKGERNPYFAF